MPKTNPNHKSSKSRIKSQNQLSSNTLSPEKFEEKQIEEGEIEAAKEGEIEDTEEVKNKFSGLGIPGVDLFKNELICQFKNDLDLGFRKENRSEHMRLAKEISHRIVNEISYSNSCTPISQFTLKIQSDWIQSIIPYSSTLKFDKIQEILQNSLDDMLSICKNCPTRCIQRLQSLDNFSSKNYTFQKDSFPKSNTQSNPKSNAKLKRNTSIKEKKTAETAISDSIFRLKIELKDVKPLVWRRIEINTDATFQELHNAIRDAFGWSGTHLHDFTYRDPTFHNRINRINGLLPDGTVNEELFSNDELQEDVVNLSTIFDLGIHHIIYTYDFGDNWEHKVINEGKFPRDNNQMYPQVIKSIGDCPEEDSRCF